MAGDKNVIVGVSLVIIFSIVGIMWFPYTPGGWAHSHNYDPGEEVDLWVNKVGPFPNPQETYPYYSLPFCEPDEKIETKTEGLGEALQGYELIKSKMSIKFREDLKPASICSFTLDEDTTNIFKNAITKQYWYQLFFDDLPIWGMVGEYFDEDEVKVFIYTHKKFSISWNGDRVIEANLTSESPTFLEPGATLDFTYSVEWKPTDIQFEDRFRRYLDKSFFEHQIHWFSIFNSFMMVIFLVGLVSMILLRTLKKDYAKFGLTDDNDFGESDVGDESGWKQVHGDVFRAPANLSLFASLVGTGHQLAILAFSVIMLCILGTYYTERGTIVTAIIVCYALTSFISGYGGGGYYARSGGKRWIRTMLMTACLFPGFSFCIAFLLNFVALSYGSLNYIPFGSMVAVISIWLFISVPLVFVGTVVGKNINGNSEPLWRVNQVPRQIPERKWYLQSWAHICLGGVLPFGSIFIEMYFIFTSFYKYYYVYGFMLLVFFILITVTVCVTIVSTYFLLNAEDYKWQWTSFLSAASTAGYVFLYSVYYFFAKTKMSGFFQTTFYFGYMLMLCSGLAIMTGAIGFIGTSLFVHKIYGMIKGD